MNTKISAQIKKGVLEMCLLHKLSQQDYYGYNLMHEMNILFPEVNSSTFYAILRRLKIPCFRSVYNFSTPNVTFSPLMFHSFVNPTAPSYLVSFARTSDLICSSFFCTIPAIFSLSCIDTRI